MLFLWLHSVPAASGSSDSVTYPTTGDSVTYPTTGRNDVSAGGGGKCVYEYATHDGAPVVTSASCSISTGDLNKGSEPGETARNYVRHLGRHDGCTNDDAGHILANRLGGKAVPTNLFPQSPHHNRGAWEVFERGIADCMQGDASSAKLSWTFTYSTSSRQRPSQASYSVSYDKGCSAASQSFVNTCTSSAPDAATLVEAATTASTASVNISCVSGGSVAPGCILHAHGDDSFAIASDNYTMAVGKQLDVIHLTQAASNLSYSAPTWCVSSKSHITSSGNLALKLGATSGDGPGLDCSSRSVDLQPGDCSVLQLSISSAEKLRVCFNGKEK